MANKQLGILLIATACCGASWPVTASASRSSGGAARLPFGCGLGIYGIRSLYSEFSDRPFRDALDETQGEWTPGRFWHLYALVRPNGIEETRIISFEHPRYFRTRLISLPGGERTSGVIRLVERLGDVHFRLFLANRSWQERTAIVRFRYLCGRRVGTFQWDFTVHIPAGEPRLFPNDPMESPD